MDDKNEKFNWWLIVKSETGACFKSMFNFVFLGLIIGSSLYGLLIILRVESIQFDHVMMTFTLVYIVVYARSYRVLANFQPRIIKIFEFFTTAGGQGEFVDRIVLTIMGLFLLTLVVVVLFLFLY